MEGRMWTLWVSTDAAVFLPGTWKISCEECDMQTWNPTEEIQTDRSRWLVSSLRRNETMMVRQKGKQTPCSDVDIHFISSQCRRGKG